MSQPDHVLTDLSRAFRQNDATIFIGAGLSIGAGLPGWSGLIRPLAGSIGYQLPDEQFITTDHLLKAAQFYENQRGSHNLLQHLRDKLNTAGKKPTRVHELIIQLPVQTIFTTNYDGLIERTFQDAGKPLNTIITNSDLSFWQEDRVQLVKLCGDLQRPDTIIFTQKDFSTYTETHRRLVERLRTTLESKTALFLGYSLQDPFFNQIWDSIGLELGKYRRTGYAVLFDAQPLDVEDLKQRGIYVINLVTGGRDRTTILTEWFEALVALVAQKSNPPSNSTGGAPVQTSQPATQPGPTVAPISMSQAQPVYLTPGSDAYYQRGLDQLKACLQQRSGDANALNEFDTLADRFYNNQRKENLMGSTETTRSERTQIIAVLNDLARRHCVISFNELCQGKLPS